jgi:2-oxoacid dehydrogenase/acyltransferase catalytic subunit
MSLEVIVGGVSQRPRVTDSQVTVRDVPDLTIAIGHNVVDGAPAARFGAGFRELVDSAAVMSPSSISLPALGYLAEFSGRFVAAVGHGQSC